MIDFASLGDWFPFGEAWSVADIELLGREVGLALPAELSEILVGIGGGHLVIEEPQAELDEPPWEYCPQFKMFGIDRIRSWRANGVARYMHGGMPIGSDAASSLFVWRHHDTHWGKIFAVQSGDLGWDSAREAGSGVGEMLTRWAALRDRRNARDRSP